MRGRTADRRRSGSRALAVVVLGALAFAASDVVGAATAAAASSPDPSDQAAGSSSGSLSGSSSGASSGPGASSGSVTGALPGLALGATEGADIMVTGASDAGGPVATGARLSYALTVTNVGSLTATGIEVVDTLPAGARVATLLPTMTGGACTVTSTVDDLGDGERWSVHCRRDAIAPGRFSVVTIDVRIPVSAPCGPMRNVVETRAANEAAADVDGGNRDTVVDEVRCTPSVRLSSAAPAIAHVGERLVYRYFVENDGDLALTNVVVRNERCDSRPVRVGEPDRNARLAVGETWTFRCSHVVVARDPDPLHATAVVTARGAGLRVRDAVEDVTGILHPSIELSQDVRPGSGAPGTRVTYRYVVTNTGDTPLLDVRVRDEVLGRVGVVERLAPGAHAKFTAVSKLPADRVLVRAEGTARGEDVTGLGVKATDHVTVTVVEAQGSGPGGPGPAPGEPPGTGTPFPNTAFSGLDATGGITIMWVLGALGAALVGVAGRRQPPPCHWIPC
jgi:uncharacterized repeat protein (TIGR01451 family)